MNKTTLTLCYLCLFSLPLRTQTPPGAWLFAPAALSHAWSAANGDEVVEEANFFSFKAMYFPARRLAVGGQLQYHGYRASEMGFRVERQISWWFMPTLRYYLSAPEKKTQFFAEAGGSVFLDRHRFGSDLNSWGGIAGIGMDAFLDEYLALEVIAGYLGRQTREQRLNGRVRTYQTDDLNLQLALRLFFQPGATAQSAGFDPKKARWLLAAWMDLDTDDDGVLNRHPFFIRGRIAYFPTPFLAFGLDGGVDLGGETLFNLKVGACREAGFFARYYWRPADRLQFFPDLGYSFSKNIYPGFYSSRARTFEGGLGANVWINDRFALETLLQYRRHRFYTENNDPAPVQQNSLGLEMSLVYFVFPKKAGV